MKPKSTVKQIYTTGYYKELIRMKRQHEEFLWNNRTLIENLKTNNAIFSRLTQLKTDLFTIIREHCNGTNLVKLYDGTIEKPFTGIVNTMTFSEHLVYRIHKDFKVIKPSIGKWVEFDIARDTEIKIHSRFGVDTRKFYLYDDISMLLCDIKAFKTFGGIQYIEPISGNTSAFTGYPLIGYITDTGKFVITYSDTLSRLSPVYPHKIRFWVENIKMDKKGIIIK